VLAQHPGLDRAMTRDDVEDIDDVDDVDEIDEIDEVDEVDEGDEGSAAVAPREEQPWTWHLIRVSGFVLAVVIPIHFVIVMISDDVGRATAASMNERLERVPWRVFEWATLTLALAHGFFATVAFVGRSRIRDSVKELLVVSLGVVCVLLGLAGSAVLLGNR
jgi:succinate dehydrogenase hydrophobic anchor subunit